MLNPFSPSPHVLSTNFSSPLRSNLRPSSYQDPDIILGLFLSPRPSTPFTHRSPTSPQISPCSLSCTRNYVITYPSPPLIFLSPLSRSKPKNPRASLSPSTPTMLLCYPFDSSYYSHPSSTDNNHYSFILIIISPSETRREVNAAISLRSDQEIDNKVWNSNELCKYPNSFFQNSPPSYSSRESSFSGQLGDATNDIPSDSFNPLPFDPPSDKRRA